MKKEQIELYIGNEFWKEWEIKYEEWHPDEERTRLFVPVVRYNPMTQDFQGEIALEFERKKGTNEFHLWSFAHKAN